MDLVVSILAPEGMPGVEFSGLAGIGQVPDRRDEPDPDAPILPRSSNFLASDAPYMTGGLFRELSPPPPSPRPVPEVPASENLVDAVTPDYVELTEQPCISYEESVFSEDIEDEYMAEENEASQVATA